MNERDEIQAIMVTLHIGGEQALFVMLGADGCINRMGTGSEDNTERDLFIGQTDGGVFRDLRGQLTPELLGWCGQRLADPQPQGKNCELTVGFQKSDGQELIQGWQYGSASQGPPPEVCRFVVAAVEATDPWFEEQKAMAQGGGA